MEFLSFSTFKISSKGSRHDRTQLRDMKKTKANPLGETHSGYVLYWQNGME